MSSPCCTRFRHHSSLVTRPGIHITFYYDKRTKEKIFLIHPSFGNMEQAEVITHCPFCGAKLK